MRLLHVAPFYEPAWERGGMARAAAGLARGLAALGHDVTVVTTRPRGTPAQEQREGVRVIRWGVLPLLERHLIPWAPGMATRLTRLAREADLVHLHGHRTGLAAAAAKACALSGVPFVLQPHGTYPVHGQQVLAKWIYDRLAGDRVVAHAAAWVAVSEAEARDLPHPATVVRNGVSVPCAPASRTSSGCSLLFIGSDRLQKRGLRLVSLMAALPGVRLELVGPFGSLFRSAFEPMADRVTWSGILAPGELVAAYARADLVVQPAVAEAFGLVAFEAALCGTAAVVAGGHGSGEWFARAGGRVVPPDDAPALLEAVKERLADAELRRREAAAVAAFAARELTWEAAARSMEGVYGPLFETRRRSAA